MSYRLPRSFNWGCLPALSFVILVGVPALGGFMVGQSMTSEGEDVEPLPYIVRLGVMLAIVVGFGVIAAGITWASNRVLGLTPKLTPPAKLVVCIALATACVWLGWEVALLVNN